MSTSPIQTSFAGGELSERVRGHIDSELHRIGLAYAENFLVTPQGPLLMRAGTMHVGIEATTPRLIPFRLLGSEEDVILAFTDGHVKGWTRSGSLRAYGANLALAAAWTQVNPYTTVIDRPDGLQVIVKGGIAPNKGHGRLQVVTVPGDPYRIRLPGWIGSALGAMSGIIRVGTAAGGADLWSKTFTTTGAGNVAFDEELILTVPGAVLYVELEILSGVANSDTFTVNPMTIQSGAVIVDLAAPWTSAQIPDLQYVAEPAKNRMFIVHPNVQPYVLTYTAPGTWNLAAAVFVGAPAAWVGTNWPGACELHQGRLLLGGTPNEPNTWWGSKSGSLLDFTAGVNPGDGYSWTVSTKGRIRWMQGQKALLLGSDVLEHSAVGSADGAIITPSSVDVRDESAHGSAAIQAVHLGDQVAFVTRERRRVRVLNYSNDDNAWISRALTFVSEHLTEGLIRDIHYARSPFAVLIVRLDSGDVRFYTYDRSEQVLAAYRVNLGAPVGSAAVADSPSGSYLWYAVERATGSCVEVMPLHEVGAVYLDSAATFGTVVVDELVADTDLDPIRAPDGSIAVGNVFPIAVPVTVSAAHIGWGWGFVGGGRVRITAIANAGTVDAWVTVEVLEAIPSAGVAPLEAGIGPDGWFWLVPVARLEDETVAAVVDGAYAGEQVAADGMAALPVREDGSAVTAVVGLPYTARAVTLPREVKTGKARDAKIGALLSNSALPLLNGKRAADRTPATPQDQPEPLRTGRCQVANLGWSDDGAVTIEQDLPFRTEILAVFAVTASERI